MVLPTAKQLSKRVNGESDLYNYYNIKQFVIHPIFLELYESVKSELNGDSTKIRNYYDQLYSHGNYPHNSYTKLCIFVGIAQYLAEQQIATYLDDEFWGLFVENYKGATTVIGLDKYLETMMNCVQSHAHKIDEEMLGHMLVELVDFRCRFCTEINVVWPVVDLLLKRMADKGWNLFVSKLTGNLGMELRDRSKLSLCGRSNFILLLKLASVCRFETRRYSKKIHLQLSSTLLRVSFQFKRGSNDYQMMSYAFMNSLLSLFSTADDRAYFQLMHESKQYFIHQPTDLRLKYMLMIKIISSLRTRLLKNHGPIEFLYICYVVYFGDLYQSANGVKTLRDVLMSYKYGYKLELELEELEIKSDEQLKKCTKSTSANRPYWLDVIVEIVVSLLVQPNRWSKKMCLMALRKLAPTHLQRSTWRILYSCLSEPETMLSADNNSSTTPTITDANTTTPQLVTKSELTEDIILDEATPEQLAELEKLSNLIRFGNPAKQAKSSSVTLLYRAFQLRILGVLELAPKLGLTKLQAIEYSKDLVSYLIDFKPTSNKNEEKNFTSKLLSTINILVHLKHFTKSPKKHCDKTDSKLLKFVSKHFIDYAYRMRKTPEFLNIWFKWLLMVGSYLSSECSLSLETVQLDILDDFLKKRNPLMKKDHIVMLLTNPNLSEPTLNCMLCKICDCLCEDKLRGPQLINISYVLSVALKTAHRVYNTLSDCSSLIESYEKVIEKSKSYPKNEKIKTNLSTCNKLLKKIQSKLDLS